MRIFTSSEIRFLENAAVDTGTTLETLMENAGTTVAKFIEDKILVKNKRVVILCGKGNNGGDGFVCARKLREEGAIVTVVLVQGEIKTELSQNAFKLMSSDINVIKNNVDRELIETADVIVDCIFGIGFRGSLDGDELEIVKMANNSNAVKIAVDIPSGAICDSAKVLGECFHADETITFTAIKPANIMHPAMPFCGHVHVADVGIAKHLFEFLPNSFSLIEKNMISPCFKPRKQNSHKGTYGRLLMICGSYGMVGAGIMAAKAALRSGVGLLNLVVDKTCYPIMAQAIPEAIFTIMDFSDDVNIKKSSNELFDALNKASACVIGSGLGTDSFRYMESVVKFAHCSLVIDADGLNFLADNLELLKENTNDIIITPHPGEMARLTKRTIAQVQEDRLSIAKRFSKEFNVFTVLKGSGTIICDKDGCAYINKTGNAGMAKGGSGDVLAGIIGSLLAQNLSPIDSANAGVYIHGTAGDICASKFSQISMLPTDLIDTLPEVFKKL